MFYTNGGMERNVVNVMTKVIRKIFFTRKPYIKKKLNLKNHYIFFIKKAKRWKTNM